jgi:hypothetical protein
MYRILENAGIRFERTRTKALQLVHEWDYADAQDICAAFLKEVDSIRSSAKKIIGLSQDDLRCLETSLNRMQRQIRDIRGDLPVSNLPPDPEEIK